MAGHYQDTIEDEVTGKPVNGATVLVYEDGAVLSSDGTSVSSGTLATIYSDDGITVIDQENDPITTASNGEFDFYTAETRVVVAILYNGEGKTVWNDQDILGGTVSSDVTSLAARVDNHDTVFGLDALATNLGTFTGSIITDNTNVVTALQELETEIETVSTADMVTDLAALADPGADRIVFYDQSVAALAWLQVGTGLSLSGTELTCTVTGISEATASAIWTGSETTTYISPDKIFDAAVPQTLTSSAGQVAINMGAGINFELTLTEASDMNNPTNAKPGQSGTMLFTQDGTGGWALTWDSNWSLIGDAPTLNTTAGAVELFGYFVRSSTDIEYWYVGPKA